MAGSGAGLTIISMLVAHTAPAGGIFNVSEYITAPLFAAILAASLHYAYGSWSHGPIPFLVAMTLRGAVLFLAGVLLQPVYAQIAVVLQWLGALTVLMAVVVVLRVRNWALIAAAAAIVASSTLLMDASRRWLAGNVDGWAAALVDFVLAGPYYRLWTMAAAGLLGVLLA